MSDSQPSGTCTTLLVMKIITFGQSIKGTFDISTIKGAKAHTGCTPWSPNLHQPSQSHLPSLRAGLYSSPLSPYLIFLLGYPDQRQQQLSTRYFVSIGFQKQWVHPSRKCALSTALLWMKPAPWFCFQQEWWWPGSRPLEELWKGAESFFSFLFKSCLKTLGLWITGMWLTAYCALRRR